MSPESDLELCFGACHGVVDTLVLAGRVNDASAGYLTIERMIGVLREPVLRAQEAWLRGRLFGKLGQRDRAIDAYREAVQIYESLPIAPELPELREELARVVSKA